MRARPFKQKINSFGFALIYNEISPKGEFRFWLSSIYKMIKRIARGLYDLALGLERRTDIEAVILVFGPANVGHPIIFAL